MIKLVFCCRRQDGMTRDAFQERWLEVHGPLVRRLREHLPMMKRYVQSHALSDEVNEPVRASRGAGEAYDGITEVWFESLETMGAGSSAAAVDAAQQLLEDEAKFLDFSRSSVFLTEEHEIF